MNFSSDVVPVLLNPIQKTLLRCIDVPAFIGRRLIFAGQVAPNILKVSVIIPLYNQKAFVKDAIDSALEQSETAEVIVVDDGSTDGSGDFVRKLARENERLRVLRHPDHGRRGVGASRNLAIQMADYPYLAFLDADDYMLPDRFAYTRRLFEQFPNADAVAEALGYENDAAKLTMLTEMPAPEDMFFQMEPFGKSGHFSVCGLTVRKDVTGPVGPFDETLRIGEDTDWLARLALKGSIFCGDLDRPVAMRRLHEANVSLDRKLAVEQKPLMALKLIDWNARNLKDGRVAETLVKLFLKYHYEANRIYGKRSKLAKKWADIRVVFHLFKIDRSLWRSPRFRYFVKTVFHLPVSRHIDYYK